MIPGNASHNQNNANILWIRVYSNKSNNNKTTHILTIYIDYEHISH